MADNTKLTIPTVHLNGTSGEELADGFLAAYRAVVAARDVLGANPPNGRDYYVQGDTAYAKAAGEHASRLNRLDAVSHELGALYEAVQDQNDARKRR